VFVQSLDGVWQLKQLGTEDWLPAQVPGGVHPDLLAAGRIPDPFIADNELRVQWVAESEWEYRRTFALDEIPFSEVRLGELRRYLVFEGLDTIADVTLNGKPLGTVDNMFRTWRWDVTDIVTPENNELVVFFHSPVKRAAELEAKRHLDHPRDSLPGGPYLRKAPCHFGWDWGPKLPNVGIWKGVRIEAWHIARMTDVRLTQKVEPSAKADKTKAQVWTEICLERVAPGSIGADEALNAVVRIEHPDGRAQTAARSIRPGDSSAKIRIEVDRPRLWWPNGMGDQPIYRVEVVLSSGDRELDSRTYQIGLRTLELRRKPDQWGESFTFVVNGVPVFARGSNWIPADSFPARVSDAVLERLIGDAAAANQNMIRVWGGGYYESESFYDLCDRHGILVWQDFMFACSVYPLTDPAFVANVRAEVAEQVARLRHRACLALWCGNNEMERGWTNWGWTRPETKDLREAYLKFFSRTLPAWIAETDRATPYWPSSPSSGKPLDAPIGDRSGDEHEWVVWHGLAPFETYKNEAWRFVSEFGFESLPAMATIKIFAPDPADWNLGSPMMDQHQKCYVGNARILYYLAQNFRLPMDFASIVYLSQIQHAEAMRVGVEHWRRERARCSGALYWQLNDCWPVSSWASIDYYGRWKALQYVARRFFAPVLMTCAVEPGGVSVCVTNDGPGEFQGEVRWAIEGLDGSTVSSGALGVTAAGAATTSVGLVAAAAGAADQVDARRLTVFVAELWSDDEMVVRTVTGFAPDKQLLLKPPRIKATVDGLGKVVALGASAGAGSGAAGSGAAGSGAAGSGAAGSGAAGSGASPRKGKVGAPTSEGSVGAPEAGPTASPAAVPTGPEAAGPETVPGPEAARSEAVPAMAPAAVSVATLPHARSRALVRLRSTSLARWVELSLEGGDTVFDDNYFDLPAGRDVAIGFTLPDGWTVERAKSALRVRSLIDTYAG
jgi:beta-mannosidase